jgi:hypothetical protein
MAFTADPQVVEDLIPPPELDDVRAFLLAYLAVPQNQIDDWLSGGALRTMWEIEAIIVQDLLVSLVAQAKNAYPDTAVDDSLTKVAHGFYGIDRDLATAATQNVTLFCDAGHGPYTAAQVAALIGMSTDGARYLLTSGAATLNPSSTVTVVFTAETPGAARGLVLALENALPGVSVQAAAIAVFGSDDEDNATLRAAMDARFDDLEPPTQDRVITWALAAAPPPLITRFRRDADPAIPGGVLVTLANAGGPVASGTVTDVQGAFDDLSPITDNNTAQNSTSHTINASGTVTVRAALGSRAQAQADAAWNAAMSGSQIGARVFLQTLREIVGEAIKADPGSNFTAEALAGADPDGNVTLSATEVPVAGDTLTNQLTWVFT